MRQKSYATAASTSTGTITRRDCLLAPGGHQTERIVQLLRSVTIHLNGGIMSENIFAAASGQMKPNPLALLNHLTVPFSCFDILRKSYTSKME